MVYKEGMDQWLLAVTSDLAAKGSAKDLEVAGVAGQVHCHFSLPPFFPYHACPEGADSSQKKSGGYLQCCAPWNYELRERYVSSIERS